MSTKGVNIIKDTKALRRNQIRQCLTNKIKRSKTMEKMVTKEMGILDIAQQYPESIEVFAKYGLGCLGCAAARFENLEAGAKVHGFDPDQMVADINEVINR